MNLVKYHILVAFELRASYQTKDGQEVLLDRKELGLKGAGLAVCKSLLVDVIRELKVVDGQGVVRLVSPPLYRSAAAIAPSP